MLSRRVAVSSPRAMAPTTGPYSVALPMDRIDVVKTHNPFVVNDLYYSQQTGFEAERMNNYGSSLIYGHPQGPTGLRLVVELIEGLALRGGGYGLFTGCAAGDTGAAVVLKVDVS
ncbi:MAG: hypothetical protein GY789_18135 [Hyphomicrobiales bacterium]|nr:hypothetical protein [Hyphomicrobiales bacterium]MCP5000184.1 hypothetical protein [Hyphomicrobiales bacterium]